ncbi:CDP-glucose 4,6-dehydratase [Synergistaceae bacterium OttesenSCG-928-I11]|nr:CDP-glucose 4,6-dehydratase [Synergistaceae bacterium OttesenSCG-928-I11]
MVTSFWQNKKIFLTGHTGFKGCWFCKLLEVLGSKIFGYSLPPAPKSIYMSIYGDELSNGFYADIRDKERLSVEMAKFSPEIVFHLAAQPLVRASYLSPSYTYDVNVIGTLNLLEAVRTTKSVKVVVVITTDKCYKDMNWEWGYREDDLLGGADPYSSSKACVELLCNAWRSSFFNKLGVSLATARAGNVIGGGDWADERIVPDAIRAFQAGMPLAIRSPKAIRPWQHVLEPLRGYMMLAEKLYKAEGDFQTAWNFGPSTNDAKNVEFVARRLADLWGDGSKYMIDEDHTLHESQTLRLDSSRSAQKIGWFPLLDFDESILMTVDWYKRVYNKEKALAVTDEQIKSYMDRVVSHGREQSRQD